MLYNKMAQSKMIAFKNIFYTGIIIMTLTMSQNAQASEKLAPCSYKPNCVSSQADAKDEKHFIEPFKINGKPDDAWKAFKQALANQSRTKIITEKENSLHAETTSAIFRFVDDLDAILDIEAGLIHIRSASRIGYSDLGVNRKRVEALRLELRKSGFIN